MTELAPLFWLVVSVVILVVVEVVLDKFVNKMNSHSTDDEKSVEFIQTEQEEKEDEFDSTKKIQAKGFFSMKNTLLRRVVKFIIFFFILGFSVVMEKTIRAEGLSETSGFDFGIAFNIIQPIYSFTIVASLLWFLIYSKWANEKIWIREKSKNIKSNDVENDEKSVEFIQTEQEEKEDDFVGNNKTSGITKEEAIAKLKELKELLELEVITQEDYDKEKDILSPIILGKE